jgi:hypothetical protein
MKIYETKLTARADLAFSLRKSVAQSLHGLRQSAGLATPPRQTARDQPATPQSRGQVTMA